MEFTTEIETKFHEYDPQGVVNNIYITGYAQQTYLKFIREEINPSWSFKNVVFYLRDNHNRFIKPMKSVDAIQCKLQVIDIRPVGFTVRITICSITDPKLIYTVNESELVHISFETEKPVIMPAGTIEKLNLFKT